MDKDGRDRGGGGGGGGGEGGGVGVDVDGAIQQLESEEVMKNIRKQFSKKKRAIGELKGKFNEHSEEKMELRPLPSTKQV